VHSASVAARSADSQDNASSNANSQDSSQGNASSKDNSRDNHYNRTFKAEQYKGLKEKKASRSSSHLCDIL